MSAYLDRTVLLREIADRLDFEIRFKREKHAMIQDTLARLTHELEALEK